MPILNDVPFFLATGFSRDHRLLIYIDDDTQLTEDTNVSATKVSSCLDHSP